MTGDLAHKKIFPALYAMVKKGDLDVPVIGVASSTVDGRRPAPACPRQHHRSTAAASTTRTPSRSSRRCCATSTATTTSRRRSPSSSRSSASCEPPGALPRHPAEHVREGRRGSRVVELRRERARHRREAVRARPRVGAGAQPGAPLGVPREGHLPDRPLPRQGGDPEPPLLPVRQLVPRADLEPQLRPPGADHDGGGLRRAGPGQVLRRGRRAARRHPEPPLPDRRAARDGAAGRARRRGAARRQGEACSTRSRR